MCFPGSEIQKKCFRGDRCVSRSDEIVIYTETKKKIQIFFSAELEKVPSFVLLSLQFNLYILPPSGFHPTALYISLCVITLLTLLCGHVVHWSELCLTQCKTPGLHTYAATAGLQA